MNNNVMAYIHLAKEKKRNTTKYNNAGSMFIFSKLSWRHLTSVMASFFQTYLMEQNKVFI